MKYLTNEITILKDINHPNIVKFVEIHETSKKIYIVTELCNGGNLLNNLENYMEKNKIAFSEEIVRYIMRQIIEGIKYLHNKKIVHTNISLDNIMINYEDENDRINNNIMKGKIKIIDFGFSKYLKKGELTNSVLGYPINMDPIILYKLNSISEYKESRYDEKVDIWSLGTICYELLIGKPPFEAVSMNELLEKIKKGYYYIPTTLSKEAISFLNCMLQLDPKKRKSVDILYNHKFLRINPNQFIKINENINLSEIRLNIKENNDLFNE